MRDFSDAIRRLRERLDEARGYLKVDAGRSRLAELELEVARPDLWDDQDLAKRINSEYANVKGDIDEFDGLASAVDDIEVLHELAREVDDASQEPEID
jgi:peptide chain release factor 2